jgi:hypothetical protein
MHVVNYWVNLWDDIDNDALVTVGHRSVSSEYRPGDLMSRSRHPERASECSWIVPGTITEEDM